MGTSVMEVLDIPSKTILMTLLSEPAITVLEFRSTFIRRLNHEGRNIFSRPDRLSIEL